MDQEQYPTKFNKYRRLMERQAQSKSSDETEEMQVTSNCTDSMTLPGTTPANHDAIMHHDFTTNGRLYNSERHSYTSNCFNVRNHRLENVVKPEAMDEYDIPLNLSTSSTRKLVSSQTERPSSNGFRLDGHRVGFTPKDVHHYNGFRQNDGLSNNGCHRNRNPATSYANGKSKVTVITQGCAENSIIEEHFQRSLGTSYSKLLDRGSVKQEAQSTSPPKSENDKTVDVTGSVDDHFTKSLGEVWTKVKANHHHPSKEHDVLPDSVDDHFAKALGETWYRIQAAGERDSSRSPQPPTGSQRPTHSNSPRHHRSSPSSFIQA